MYGFATSCNNSSVESDISSLDFIFFFLFPFIRLHYASSRLPVLLTQINCYGPLTTTTEKPQTAKFMKRSPNNEQQISVLPSPKEINLLFWPDFVVCGRSTHHRLSLVKHPRRICFTGIQRIVYACLALIFASKMEQRKRDHSNTLNLSVLKRMWPVLTRIRFAHTRRNIEISW